MSLDTLLNNLDNREKDSTPHISYSQINTFLTCPRRYYYSYVRLIKQPPSGAMLFGSSVGVALEKTYQDVIKNGHTSPSYSADIFADVMKVKYGEIDKTNDDEKLDTLLEQGDRLLKLHTKDRIPKQEPIDAEHKIELELPGVELPLVGYIDLLETGNRITDHKTTTKKYAEAKNPKRSLQLGLYAMAMDATSVGYDVLVRKSNPEIQVLRERLSADDLKWVVGSVVAVAQQIEMLKDIAGVIWPPCDPTSWVCSEKFCGYYRLCQSELKEMK